MANLDVCAGERCRRRDIAVILRGPRGAQIPVCTVCWGKQPEALDTQESCDAVDRWYDALGAARPERRGWPPIAAPRDSHELAPEPALAPS